MVAERDTAVIEAAKTSLQMFIVQCFSVRKLQHDPTKHSTPSLSARTMV